MLTLIYVAFSFVAFNVVVVVYVYDLLTCLLAICIAT